jgi:hypothetical protein
VLSPEESTSLQAYPNNAGEMDRNPGSVISPSLLPCASLLAYAGGFQRATEDWRSHRGGLVEYELL